MVIIEIFVIFLSLVWMHLLFINLWLLCVCVCFFNNQKISMQKEQNLSTTTRSICSTTGAVLLGHLSAQHQTSSLNIGIPFKGWLDRSRKNCWFHTGQSPLCLLNVLKLEIRGLFKKQPKKKKYLRIVEYYLSTIR